MGISDCATFVVGEGFAYEIDANNQLGLGEALAAHFGHIRALARIGSCGWLG